jgi:hypothetical protein
VRVLAAPDHTVALHNVPRLKRTVTKLLSHGCCEARPPGCHKKATMSKLAMLRTGVVAAGAARGVVSPVCGHSQVAVDTAEESDAAQVAQKPRKVPTFLANISCALSDSARRGCAANQPRWAAGRCGSSPV